MKRLKDLETENARLCKAVADLPLDKLILGGSRSAKFGVRTSARLCRACATASGASERRVCGALGRHRSTQRKAPRGGVKTE